MLLWALRAPDRIWKASITRCTDEAQRREAAVRPACQAVQGAQRGCRSFCHIELHMQETIDQQMD